jgi:hypothetical protein
MVAAASGRQHSFMLALLIAENPPGVQTFQLDYSIALSRSLASTNTPVFRSIQCTGFQPPADQLDSGQLLD